MKPVTDVFKCEFYSVKIRFFSVREILKIQSNLYNNMGHYLLLKKYNA